MPARASDDRQHNFRSGVAGVHACSSEIGTVYQDRPCAVPAPVVEPAELLDRAPAGIDPSWLVRPDHANYEAGCLANGCDCGPFVRSFQSGKVQAVADALYLDGQWHRYDTLSDELARPDMSARRAELEDRRQEASCDIQMSQAIIRRFAESVLHTMRAKKREAENRGHDDPARCEAGLDPLACEGLDAIALNARLVEDVRALGRKRQALGVDTTRVVESSQ